MTNTKVSCTLHCHLGCNTDGLPEICEDIQEECSKYGQIEEMKVPRPSGGSRQSNGVGKIYIKYDSNDSASKALRALAGRKFADRTVVVTYFGEVRFVPPFLPRLSPAFDLDHVC